MKFTSKDYKTIKIKNHLKNNNLFFFFNGVNQDSNSWLKTEQGLKNKSFNYYKVFNKTTTRMLKTSIYKNVEPVINSITFVIKPISNNIFVSKKMLLNLETFIFLTMKINAKIYSINQLQSINSLDYYDNNLLLYQFGITSIKPYFSK